MAKDKSEKIEEALAEKPKDCKYSKIKAALSLIAAGASGGVNGRARDLFVVPEGVVYQEYHAANPSATAPIAKVDHFVNILVPWDNVAEVRLEPGTTIYGIPVYPEKK